MVDSGIHYWLNENHWMSYLLFLNSSFLIRNRSYVYLTEVCKDQMKRNFLGTQYTLDTSNIPIYDYFFLKQRGIYWYRVCSCPWSKYPNYYTRFVCNLHWSSTTLAYAPAADNHFQFLFPNLLKFSFCNLWILWFQVLTIGVEDEDEACLYVASLSSILSLSLPMMPFCFHSCIIILVRSVLRTYIIMTM